MSDSDEESPTRTEGLNTMNSDATSRYGPISQLVIYFVLWKAVLLIVASASPGPGYDTSTQILLDHSGPTPETWPGRALQHVLLRLTRWDGIYFASNSERGHVNEQDWAFSWALARVTSCLAKGAYGCRVEKDGVAKLSTPSILQSLARHYRSPRSSSTHYQAFSSPTHRTLQLFWRCIT